MSIVAIVTDKIPEEDSRQYFFGANDSAVAKDGTIVRVWPKDGDPWFGFFSKGSNAAIQTTGVHVWQASTKFFVASKGRGFLVDGNDPDSWIEAHLYPVAWYISYATDGLLLISDNIRIAAYSTEGLLWKTEQISWNGIRNLKHTVDGIQGEAWDDLWDCWVSFVINIETGEHLGGATFNC